MGNGEEKARNLVVTDDLLIRYLLGELEKAERMQVAERSFCDDELFDRLMEAENDLVDRYVRGELPRPERDRFERAAAERETLREKVAFAGALGEAMSNSGQVATGRDLRFRTASGKGTHRKYLWYQLAAAASLLLVIGGLWIARRSQQRPTATAQLQQVQEGDVRTSNEARPGPDSADVNRNAQVTPAVGDESTPRYDQAGGAGAGHNPAASVAAFVLLPGSTRSAGEPQVLTVSSGVRSVRLQLQLDETEQYPAYTAVLRTLHGDLVLKRPGLRPSRAPFGKALTLELAARDLGPGQYEVQLDGHPRTGPDTVVNYYYFSISKE
jgi:hypothetical protein